MVGFEPTTRRLTAVCSTAGATCHLKDGKGRAQAEVDMCCSKAAARSIGCSKATWITRPANPTFSKLGGGRPGIPNPIQLDIDNHTKGNRDVELKLPLIVGTRWEVNLAPVILENAAPGQCSSLATESLGSVNSVDQPLTEYISRIIE